MALVIELLETTRRTAPAIRARSKTRHSPSEIAMLIEFACAMNGGSKLPMPIVIGRDYVGMMHGDPDTGDTFFTPRVYCAPLDDSYDAVRSKNAAGKQHRFTWNKRKDAFQTAGRWHDLWAANGDPPAGSYGGTARTARQWTRTSSGAGAMRIGPSKSPSVKYMRRAATFKQESTASTGLVMVSVYDRGVSYDGCSMSTSSQSMTNTLAATRWISSGDRGFQIIGTCDAVQGSGAADLSTLTYTNESGTGSRVVPTSPTLSRVLSLAAPTAGAGAPILFQQPGLSTRSNLPWLNLQSGDRGVRSIQDYQWTGAPTGTCSWVLGYPYFVQPDFYRMVLASDVDFIAGIDALGEPKIYDDACLSVLAWSNTTTAGPLEGYISIGWT